jgi:CheY-like chemotaxis protein
MRDSLACHCFASLYPSTVVTTSRPCPKRVLVLDNDKIVADATATVLSQLGYETQSEANPAKSIRRILEKEFDLLLTDYLMPGLNGLEVAQILRTMGSMIPVILCTAEADPFDTDDLRLLGILGVIRKPFSINEFNVAFNRILHAAQN